MAFLNKKHGTKYRWQFLKNHLCSAKEFEFVLTKLAAIKSALIGLIGGR